MSFWLLKTEPETYSFAQLIKDKKTNWNGVRNFQARNFLRAIATGDRALIYHSGDDKAVVGIAEVVRAAYKDPDPEGGDWVQVDLKPLQAFKTPVPLAQIKSTSALADMPLIRQSRLSVMPITAAHYKTLTKLGGAAG
jgi:predicted RNA-binding protein with PUA-like domain